MPRLISYSDNGMSGMSFATNQRLVRSGRASLDYAEMTPVFFRGRQLLVASARLESKANDSGKLCLWVVDTANGEIVSTFAPGYVMFAPRIEAVFSLYAMLMLAMALVFEMPAVVLVLARMGVVTAGFLWRHIKYAVLIIFIVAAVITPTGDMVTQSLMAGPMLVLYLLSILLALIFGKRRRKADPAGN